MTWWKRYKLRRVEEKLKLKNRFKGKDNILFNVQLFTYSITVVFMFIMIFGMLVGPYNVFKEYTYYQTKDADVVQSVVQFCKYQDGDHNKIYCVNEFVNEHFNYLLTQKIINPDDLIENGGDCKSWSNFYITTLRQLGISVNQDFSSVDRHTFVIADTDDGYCVIDQRNVDCNYLGYGETVDEETGNYISFN